MVEILLVSNGFFHPPWLARRAVRETLETAPGSRFTQVSHLNALLGLDIKRYQALVLYYHLKDVEAEAVAALDRFVQKGGGILAIHSATASFKDQADAPGARYFEILGGRFIGHGPVQSFRVSAGKAAGEAVFGGVGEFVVKDELYLHDLQADIRAHFIARHEGRPVPVVWTREEGRGRVCYVGPGHRTATMQQPQLQEILRSGLSWVLKRF